MKRWVPQNKRLKRQFALEVFFSILGALALYVFFVLGLSGCNGVKRLTEGQEIKPEVMKATPLVSPFKVDTILLAGQSNMVRIEWYSLDEFKKKYEETHPNHTVSFVQCAVGGTSSNQWNSTGQLWGGCYDAAKGKIITGIAIYQGESDAVLKETDWETNWQDAISAWRRYWGNLPVVFAQLGVCLPSFAQESDWDAVKQIQANSNFPNSKMIKTDDIEVLAQGDDVHMDSASAQKIADRFAEAF